MANKKRKRFEYEQTQVKQLGLKPTTPPPKKRKKSKSAIVQNMLKQQSQEKNKKELNLSQFLKLKT